jgi:predicted nucleic acid-binding protein
MPVNRYWDSDACIAYLAEELLDNRFERCAAVIEQAERGDAVIVVSAITLTEVLYLKGRTKITPDKEARIREFFLHEWIVLRVVDRPTAEAARKHIWQDNIKPKDSIHLATALLARVDRLDSFDADLCDLTHKYGSPPLPIGWPDLPSDPMKEGMFADEPEP